MVKVNNIFTGKIDGVTPYERYGQIGRLDRNQGALKNRMENINEIIENDDFFMDYFDEYYNPILDDDSALSEENNICQMLSSMADYLINSDESRKMEEENKTEYVFTDDYFDKKTKRHESFNQESVNDDNSNKQYIQKPKESTKFKNDKLKIKKKDFTNRDEMSSILVQYQSFIDRINLIIDQDRSNTRRYNNIKSSLLDDMKFVKESYLGVLPHSKNIPHGHYLKPIPSPDYSDIKVFRSMINSSPVGLEDNYESWENYYDFTNIIEEMFYNGTLDYEEVGIINLRMYGFEYKEIIDVLGINCKTKDYEKEINTFRIRKIHHKLNEYLKEEN